GEDLILDPGRAVLADVARLGGEHDRRLALPRQQHVGVSMDDDETGHVCHGALEARVLRAGDEDRVDAVLVHSRADEPVTALDFRRTSQSFHDSSTPRTSAQTALLSGVATPRHFPNRTMPPFR